MGNSGRQPSVAFYGLIRPQIGHRFTTIILAASFGLSLSPWGEVSSSEPAAEPTRIGLFVTREEVDIWRQRAANGPYKSVSDVSVNSPGDWDRIKASASSYLLNPAEGHWKGNTSGVCYKDKIAPAGAGGFSFGYKIKDAAFAYLVNQDSRLKEAVKNELLSLASEPGLDWSNEQLYGCSVSGHLLLEVNVWILKHLIAYSFIRHAILPSETAVLDNWFKNYGLRFEKYDTSSRNANFVDRQNGDYTPKSQSCPTSGGNFSVAMPLYFQSFPYVRCAFHQPWDNTHDLTALTYGLIGVMLDQPYLKTQAKSFFQEFIRYQMWPNGVVGDSFRWYDGYASKGTSYPMGQIYFMSLLAEAFARAGDTSLFDYVTSVGHLSSQGGMKSLRLGVVMNQDRMDHTVIQFGTNDPQLATNAGYVLDTVMRVAPSAYETADDALSAMITNKYYLNQKMKDRYLRISPGSPAYPASWTTSCGGGKDWGSQGTGCFMPGIFIMFGQMEGQVRPYPANPTPTEDTLAPAVSITGPLDGGIISR